MKSMWFVYRLFECMHDITLLSSKITQMCLVMSNCTRLIQTCCIMLLCIRKHWWRPFHISCKGVLSSHSTHRLKWLLAHTDGPSVTLVCSRSHCEWLHCCAHSGVQLMSKKNTRRGFYFHAYHNKGGRKIKRFRAGSIACKQIMKQHAGDSAA